MRSYLSKNILLNKALRAQVKQAKVASFDVFENAGYKGLYHLPLNKLEKVKGVPKGLLFDYIGSAELAANLFRITQTEAKIRKEDIRGQDDASRTHFSVGSRVRQTIKDIGGVMPERLPVEKHIKELKTGVKKLNGATVKPAKK